MPGCLFSHQSLNMVRATPEKIVGFMTQFFLLKKSSFCACFSSLRGQTKMTLRSFCCGFFLIHLKFLNKKTV